MPAAWLIGMMGSGKTTVGRILATRLGLDFVDTDHTIVEHLGCSIDEFWEANGERAFRDVEELHVAQVSGHHAVIATGGGVVLRPSNIVVMQTTGPVVWLRAPVKDLARRVGQGSERPLISGGEIEEDLRKILDVRSELYEQAATTIVDTGGKSISDVTAEVERWIAS